MRNFSELSRGDHIAWKHVFRYRYHAIVESIDPVESTINLIGFWIEKPRKCITVKLIIKKVDLKKEKIYRIEYTNSHEPELVIDRAISHVGSAGYSVVTNNTYTFARWCKIGKHNPDIDYSDISGLRENVLPKAYGEVPVTDPGCLKLADHVSWKKPGYSHHGIVTDKTEDTITVTEYAPPKSKKIKGEILQKNYNIYDKCDFANMYLSKYTEDEDPSIVVKRALICVGQQGYHVLKKQL